MKPSSLSWPLEREEHGEPDEGREHVAFLRDVPEGQDAGREQDAEAEEGDRGRVEAERRRRAPEADHAHERRGHDLLVRARAGPSAASARRAARGASGVAVTSGAMTL